MHATYEKNATDHLVEAQKYADRYRADGLEKNAELARHHREMAHTYAILAKAAGVRR